MDIELTLTEQERERGYIMLTMLPEQASVLNELLQPRGFCISPAANIDGSGEEVRILQMTDELVEKLRENE